MTKAVDYDRPTTVFEGNGRVENAGRGAGTSCPAEHVVNASQRRNPTRGGRIGTVDKKIHFFASRLVAAEQEGWYCGD